MLIRSVGQSSGHTLTIVESEDPRVIAAFGVGTSLGFTTEFTLKTINIAPGANYVAYHNLAGPYVGMRLEGVEDFTIEALGLPERAPATMVRNPTTTIIPGLV